MKKILLIILVSLCAMSAIIFTSSNKANKSSNHFSEYTPDTVHVEDRKLRVQHFEAMLSIQKKEYARALVILTKIKKVSPNWKPSVIEAQMKICIQQMENNKTQAFKNFLSKEKHTTKIKKAINESKLIRE